MNGEGHHHGHGDSFVIPCVMLMLQHGSREAEGLRSLVAAFGFRRQAADMALILERLHDDGLVATSGQPADEGGPARAYELTAEGRRWLTDRSQALSDPARLVARFLDRYTPSGVMPSPAARRESTEAVGME